MTTIEDVARRAGVSTSTVSHVMNGTRKVNEGTSRQVREAIAALNYRPNILARSLARSVSNTIGIVVSAGSNPHFSDIVFAVTRECAALGFTPLLADSQDDPAREFELVRMLHARRVDGVVLVPLPGAEQASLAYLRAHAVPTVLVDQLSDDHFDRVGIENTEAASLLTTHLARLGHVRIGVIGGFAGGVTTQERLRGYRQALALAGLPTDDALLRIGLDSAEAAAVAACDLVTRTAPPTALIAFNNLSVIGAMRGLRRLGRIVPRDMALVGFDDFDWADCFAPGLTTIRQPCAGIGRQTAALLARRIREPGAAVQEIRLTAELVVRQSCGAA